MHVIKVTNVNEAMYHGLLHLYEYGIEEQTRNGPCLVAPTPVCTVYSKPWERVLFSPLRDANPFFHLMEALWMLAGRNDVAFPTYFNSKFINFSDNKMTIFGAYGMRWREFFGYDQLLVIADELRKNPNSRRCVLSMWNAAAPNAGQGSSNFHDLDVAINGVGETRGSAGRDVPCNTHAYFDVRHGVLNMTVCCRSNDVWWGAYGANAVHFSILQEYLAEMLGVDMGEYRQISNNFHIYTQIVPREKLPEFARNAALNNRYSGAITDFKPAFSKPMFNYNIELWTPKHINDFIDADVCANDFLKEVAKPMRDAYRERKEKMGTGLRFIEEMPDCDWKIACKAWILHRMAAHAQKKETI